MSKSVFISYSRREAPFVDSLLDNLEDSNINTWADYQSLIPGKPWLEQILAGINAADIFLLVVSKASIASQNVELEYQHALEQKKRILLILFEAVTLPTALQACEWVDFRTSFMPAYQKLIKQLEQPATQNNIPQKGFRAPAIVWASFFISLIVLLLSIPSWWTLFIPILLIPLPMQVITRSVNYYRARFALLTLPITVIFSGTFFPYTETYRTLLLAFGCVGGFLVSLVMLALLSSKGMRRWGKPGSSVPKFANPYKPEGGRAEPTQFLIEYAREDKKYAEAIIANLTEYNHPQVTDPAQAKICFTILSRYKNSTAIDPEKHALYPLVIQDTQVDDPRIQRIQWIDFRRGLQNLDSLAMLLPQPAKMLKALGVAPIGRQVLYPRIIQIMDYYMVLLGFFWLSIWIPLGIQLGKELMPQVGTVSILINAVLIVLSLAALFSARQALVNRQGRLASPWTLSGLLFTLGMISFAQTIYLLAVIDNVTKVSSATATTDMRGAVIMFLPCSFMVGFILIIFLSLWNWQDLMRWFPYKGK
jgi:hypothetical protein